MTTPNDTPQRDSGIRWAALLPLLVFAVVVGFFVWGLVKGDPRRLPSMLIGKPAPQFDLPALPGITGPDGKPIPALSSAHLTGPTDTAGELKGVKMLNFFASWCTGCRAEHPFIMRLAQRGELPIYGIAYKDQPEKSLAWLRELGNPYQRIGVDLKGRVGIDFGVYGIPETFFIDERGIVIHKFIGPLSERAWREQVLPTLKKALAERNRKGAS